MCWTSCCCTPRVRARTQHLRSITEWTRLFVVVDFVFHLFVLPGSIGHAHALHSVYCCAVHLFFAGSSSLSPYVYVLFPRFFTWFCHSRVVARLDVREFYDLYWISTTNRCVRIPKISSIRDRARFPCCVGFNSATAHPVSSRSIPAPRQTGSRENITHSRAR